MKPRQDQDSLGLGWTAGVVSGNRACGCKCRMRSVREVTVHIGYARSQNAARLTAGLKKGKGTGVTRTERSEAGRRATAPLKGSQRKFCCVLLFLFDSSCLVLRKAIFRNCGAIGRSLLRFGSNERPKNTQTCGEVSRGLPFHHDDHPLFNSVPNDLRTSKQVKKFST